jgi:hypothetical protein
MEFYTCFESCDASFNCKISLAHMKDGGRLAIELDNLDWDSGKYGGKICPRKVIQMRALSN